MTFIRTRDATALIGIVMAISFLSIPVVLAWEHYCWDATVAWYEEAAALAEDSPEIREDLRKYREDGILTRHEIQVIKAKHRKLRKDKATRAFSEQ